MNKCFSCGGPFHPATGHYHRPDVPVCGPCSTGSPGFFGSKRTSFPSRWNQTRPVDEAVRGICRRRDEHQARHDWLDMKSRRDGLMGSRLFREQEIVGSTPTAPTGVSSNGRAAVLQTADGGSIPSARTLALVILW